MMPEDVQRIEQELGLKVPESYASVVLNYPCPEVEGICRHGLFSDSQYVIEVNLEHRKEGWFGLAWPNHFLAIGDDGCGDTYFMVIGKDDKVYMADHEGGPCYETELDDCVSSESVQEHIEYELDLERWSQEEERRRDERRRNKKWWQFWI
ncbi:MAG: SMI1/KNR4 family protein [Planctomycetota bacterium]|nr:SMI1/KNR4 family protein [Planctomycetota bacterium]